MRRVPGNKVLLLVSSEEERVILPDRSAERAPFLVVAKSLCWRTRWDEPIARSQEFISIEIVEGTVEIVSSRLDNQIQSAARIPALLGTAIR